MKQILRVTSINNDFLIFIVPTKTSRLCDILKIVN